MFKLCSVDAKHLATVFGNPGVLPGDAPSPPKYQDLEVIMIGQKPDCSGYLVFSNEVVSEFTKHDTVPEGYDFIFRQEWGLRITEEILHRVIDTLRKESYPPMSDYVDAVVKNDQAQLDDYLAKCLAVKAKYPKFNF